VVADDFEQRFTDNYGYHVAPDLIEATVLDFDNWPGHMRTAAFTSPDLITFFAEQSPPTIAWLKSLGLHFGGIGFYGLTARSSPRIAISGGGLHLVEVMTERAVALGVQFSYETCARDLIRGEAGGVAGVIARGRNDKPLTLRAAAVLGCGAFEGNPEMVARYIGPKGRYLRPVASGGYYNKGEGIAMALRLGAAPAGDFSEYHAQPIDPRSSATEPIVMMFPYGVLLNREGRRFVNEAPGPIDASYEDISRRIAEQPAASPSACSMRGSIRFPTGSAACAAMYHPSTNRICGRSAGRSVSTAPKPSAPSPHTTPRARWMDASTRPCWTQSQAGTCIPRSRTMRYRSTVRRMSSSRSSRRTRSLSAD
jgi:hypothetical protein